MSSNNIDPQALLAENEALREKVKEYESRIKLGQNQIDRLENALRKEEAVSEHMTELVLKLYDKAFEAVARK